MSIELAICGRFGLTYTVNMVFKSDSINSCMHTQVALNGVPDLTFHVKYESFCFFATDRIRLAAEPLLP